MSVYNFCSPKFDTNQKNKINDCNFKYSVQSWSWQQCYAQERNALCVSCDVSELAVIGIVLLFDRNKGNVNPQLAKLDLVNVNHHTAVMSLDDIICSLKAICQSGETERCWYLTTRNNMPFNSNVWLTREKDITFTLQWPWINVKYYLLFAQWNHCIQSAQTEVNSYEK